MTDITTALWFDGQAEEAARFYVSLIPDSRITEVTRYSEAGPGEAGSAWTVSFELGGRPYLGINGGPMFTFTPAISLMVWCDSQEEVDRYWDALVDGGAESQCGWLVDRYGLSWQVVPTALPELLSGGGDGNRAARVMQTMLPMTRLDIAALQAAYDAG